MAETTEKTGDKKLSITSAKTLSLKSRGSETGVVRQSFSHGRTKAVVVEKVRSRTPGKAKAEAAPPPAATPARRSATGKAAASAAPATAPTATPAAAAPKPSGVVLHTLTDEERNRRAHALGDARLREAEERKIAEEDARIREQRAAVERAERVAAETRKRDEELRRRHDDEIKHKADEVAKKRLGGEEVVARPGMRPVVVPEDDDEAPRPRRPGAARPAAAPRPTRTTVQKPRGRLTVVTAFKADEEPEHSVAAFKRRIQRRKKEMSLEPKEKLVREVTIPEVITIQELANRMAEPARSVIAILMKQGQMLKITDSIDADTAQLIAEELGHTVKRVAESDVE
jgi:translation initiation factor IF-2